MKIVFVSSAAVLIIFTQNLFAQNTGPGAACYFDRAPGGCWDRFEKSQQQEKHTEPSSDSFNKLIQQVGPSALPPKCYSSATHPA